MYTQQRSSAYEILQYHSGDGAGGMHKHTCLIIKCWRNPPNPPLRVRHYASLSDNPSCSMTHVGLGDVGHWYPLDERRPHIEVVAYAQRDAVMRYLQERKQLTWWLLTGSLEHVQSGRLSGIRETLSVWNTFNPGDSLGYGKHCRNMSNVCSLPVSSLHNATRAACGANIEEEEIFTLFVS